MFNKDNLSSFQVEVVGFLPKDKEHFENITKEVQNISYPRVSSMLDRVIEEVETQPLDLGESH